LLLPSVFFILEHVDFFVVLYYIELLKYYFKVMIQGFWKKLEKPFFVLAPMLDITDSPFRRVVAKCGKPDVFYTWFISVDGLCSVGKDNILMRPNLEITKKEKPIVVQLFGKDPEKFKESAKFLSKMGFDGIDINFGCPDKDVVKQGGGAALIKNPKLAREIIQATKKGAESAGRRIPVSVKTRLGFYKKIEAEEWIAEILKENVAAICIHGRTAKQGYGGEVDWNMIKKIAEIAKKNGTLIIGNGDIKNQEEGISKAREYGLDGMMVGRAVLSDPWIFSKEKKEISKDEKLKILTWHAAMFEKKYKNKKNFNNFKKYLRSYVSGFSGAKELRMKMMEAKSAGELKKIVELEMV
jgi:nifR3 family TIM-barrel protein